jgi:Ca-activated chloride channel family protein
MAKQEGLELKVARAVVEGQDWVVLELRAPKGKPLAPEAALVMDRSGSMSGNKLVEAKAAALTLLEAFPEEGRLGLVAYDHEVMVGGFLDRKGARAFLKGLEAGGSTALHAGWEAGVELLSDPSRPRFVFLLSDGLANVGLQDPRALAAEARRAAERGVYTYTLGFGEDYDRFLLEGMALEGGGTHRYAPLGTLRSALEEELAFLKGPVNLGVWVRGRDETRHLGPFAPGERRHLLLRVRAPVSEKEVLEVGERLPGKTLSHYLSLPEPAPEGSEAWQRVRQEWVFQKGRALLREEVDRPEKARLWVEESRELKELLGELPQTERGEALAEALEAFEERVQKLREEFDPRRAERLHRRQMAFASQMESEERLYAAMSDLPLELERDEEEGR